jgi:flavodoxin
MAKNIIFYFTGTGNSLKVSKDIAKVLDDCRIVSMPAYKEHKVSSEFDGNTIFTIVPGNG